MWDARQRQRIERAVQFLEHNPPGQIEENVPQAQLLSGSVNHVADIQLEDTKVYTSANSGWNLLGEFYFGSVTNSQGQSDPALSDYSWSQIFDPRDSLGYDNPLGLRVKKAGTYFGVIQFVTLELQASLSNFNVGAVVSTFSEPDTGTPVWEANGSGLNMRIDHVDGIEYEMRMILTEPENTTFTASGPATAGYAYFERAQTISRIQGRTRNNFTLPFFFSLDNDNVPAELQIWVNIRVDATHWTSASTTLTFQASSLGQRSWIRYVPDITAYPDTRVGVVAAP